MDTFLLAAGRVEQILGASDVVNTGKRPVLHDESQTALYQISVICCLWTAVTYLKFSNLFLG